MKNKSCEDRFWAKVDRSTGDCWTWTAVKNNKGYGMFRLGSASLGKVLAHRFSYELAKGKIPKGAFILHSCDNGLCVNPSHLRVGNHAENMRDAASRGRSRNGWMSGKMAAMPRKNRELVTNVRTDFCAGMQRSDIAEKYNIPVTTVSDYCQGRSHLYLLGNGSPSLDDLRQASAKKMWAKLSKEKVDEIRKRLECGELGKDLAVIYGVHKATISDIKSGKTWLA
jgi:transcriptional regulator with XRE-family HTH domain